MPWFSPFFSKMHRDFADFLPWFSYSPSGVVQCSHGTGSVGHRVNGFRFSKKCPKCKTYIWNAEMTKVIVSCLLLDWNHWMSVHAMNFYFYLRLLKILWPDNTSSWRQWRHCSIFTFTIEQGHRVNWVSGSPDSRVTESQNVAQFHVWWCGATVHITPVALASCPTTRPTAVQCRTPGAPLVVRPGMYADGGDNYQQPCFVRRSPSAPSGIRECVRCSIEIQQFQRQKL